MTLLVKKKNKEHQNFAQNYVNLPKFTAKKIFLKTLLKYRFGFTIKALYLSEILRNNHLWKISKESFVEAFDFFMAKKFIFYLINNQDFRALF